MRAYYSLTSRLIFILLNFIVLIPVTVHASINDLTSINIGLLAVESKEQCFDQWRPTAEYLHSVLPDYSTSIVCLNFDEVEKAVYNGLVDFTITNPAVYVNLEFIYGASRIATLKGLGGNDQSTQFGGVLFKI